MNTGMTLVSGVAAVLRRVAKSYSSGLCGVLVVPTLLASTPSQAADATHMVTTEAQRQGVPVTFALKIARIESGVRCGQRNPKSTASGPLQVLKGTARAMGYRGDIRRAGCGTQTHYGMRHLAMCYRAARGNQALAKRCHQQGISAIYKKKRGKHK